MEPFDVLIDIAHRSHQAARDLPPREATRPHWMGLGFRLMGQRFVTPMNEVAELLRMPAATVLPGVAIWLSGIANFRGRLMTLIDLSLYFGTASSRSRAQRRVYVLEGDDFYYGFIVDESLGLQHFSLEYHTNQIDEVPEVFLPYLRGSYNTAAVNWPVMSLVSLAKDVRSAKVSL